MSKLPEIGSSQSWISRMDPGSHKLLLIFWMVLFAVDMAQRLSADSDQQDAVSRIEPFPLIDAPLFERDLFGSYIKKILLRVGAGEETLTAGAGPTEDAIIDSGALSDFGSLHGDNYSYTLMGIFGSSEHLAVLKRTHRESNRSDLLDVRIGDFLDGFRVDVISAHQINATHPNGEQTEMRLFAPVLKTGVGSSIKK